MEDIYLFLLALFGVGCVTFLEVYAISRKMNGTYLAAAVGAICTIIGLAFGVLL